ncbi:hypothetical protein N0V86_009641 [Didymella sp. IMI 355093]|nr:hypothetical protein N0V86_009641 [Didymella sp. IMI 355093]
MGGLVVDMSRDLERTWPASCNTLTITPACFEELFEKPGFCDIDLSFVTRDKIEARQKTDNLAKLLVIIQALWFCINFIVRINQKLPVSLLELNTFAHALCALFIYMLWWHKPGDIEDPFVLRTEKSEALRDLCAAQWTSGASGKLYEGRPIVAATKSPADGVPWMPMFLHGGSELAMNLARGRNGITLCPGSGEDWYLFDYSNRWFYFPHLPKTVSLHLRTVGPPPTNPVIAKAGESVPDTPYKLASQFLSLHVDEVTTKRWRRTFAREDLTRNYTVWLRDRQPNFAWPRGLDDSRDGSRIAEELLKSLFMLLLTSLCYGGLHMLAWGSSTVGRTPLTQMLWKVSCLLLISIGPFAYAVWLGLKLWRGADAHLRLNQSLSIIFGVLGVTALIMYVFSRVYLIIEILLVVPFVDSRVYEEAELSAYWPHF